MTGTEHVYTFANDEELGDTIGLLALSAMLMTREWPEEAVKLGDLCVRLRKAFPDFVAPRKVRPGNLNPPR